MRVPRQLVHTAWFDYALQKVAALPKADDILAEEFLRLALYADLVPVVAGCERLRLYQTKPLLRADGQLVKLLIFFALNSDDSVELQHIEMIEENMFG